MRRAISDLCPDLATLDLMERGDAAMAEGEALVAALRSLQARAEAMRREWEALRGPDPQRPRRSRPTPDTPALNTPPKLLGTYATPTFDDGLSSAPIRWPVGQTLPKGRARSLVLYGALARAVRDRHLSKSSRPHLLIQAPAEDRAALN